MKEIIELNNLAWKADNLNGVFYEMQKLESKLIAGTVTFFADLLELDRFADGITVSNGLVIFDIDGKRIEVSRIVKYESGRFVVESRQGEKTPFGILSTEQINNLRMWVRKDLLQLIDDKLNNE